MVTKESLGNNTEKPYTDPNLMPFSKADTQPMVEVEGRGVVPISETGDIPGSLLTEVTGQTHALPSSEEGKLHGEQQAELSIAAREAAATALHSTVEVHDTP